jgi:hypothetical protein
MQNNASTKELQQLKNSMTNIRNKFHKDIVYKDYNIKEALAENSNPVIHTFSQYKCPTKSVKLLKWTSQLKRIPVIDDKINISGCREIELNSTSRNERIGRSSIWPTDS